MELNKLTELTDSMISDDRIDLSTKIKTIENWIIKIEDLISTSILDNSELINLSECMKYLKKKNNFLFAKTESH